MSDGNEGGKERNGERAGGEMVLLEDALAVEIQARVQASLPAEAEKDSIGTLLGNDGLNKPKGDQKMMRQRRMRQLIRRNEDQENRIEKEEVRKRWKRSGRRSGSGRKKWSRTQW